MVKRGMIGVAALSFGLVACGGNSPEAEEYLEQLKADPTVGSVFADGEYDDEALGLAEDICDGFRQGRGIIQVSVEGAETTGLSVEVTTSLALLASNYYCPDVDVLP